MEPRVLFSLAEQKKCCEDPGGGVYCDVLSGVFAGLEGGIFTGDQKYAYRCGNPRDGFCVAAISVLYFRGSDIDICFVNDK